MFNPEGAMSKIMIKVVKKVSLDVCFVNAILKSGDVECAICIFRSRDTAALYCFRPKAY